MELKVTRNSCLKLFEYVDKNIINKKIKSSEVNNIAFSLFFSIYDESEALLHLIDKDLLDPANIILRNIYEGYIDLINLSEDRNYLYAIKYKIEKNKVQTINNIKKYYNTDFDEKILKDIEKTANNYQEQILNTKENDFWKVSKRFTEAGELKTYKVIYKIFSGSVHHYNIDRRVEKNTIKTRMKFSKENTTLYYNMLYNLLFESINLVLKIASNKEFEKKI